MGQVGGTVVLLQEGWGLQRHLCSLTPAQEQGIRVTPAGTAVRARKPLLSTRKPGHVDGRGPVESLVLLFSPPCRQGTGW